MMLLESQEEEMEDESATFGDITMSEMTTVTRSMNDSIQSEKEQWEAERIELRTEIADLKAQLAKYKEKDHRTAPLLNLYRRELQVKNGSGAYVINPEVNRLSVVLARFKTMIYSSSDNKFSYGFPVTKLHQFHGTFFEMFADSFVDPDSEATFKPPSREHLQKLRYNQTYTSQSNLSLDLILIMWRIHK